MAIMGLASLGLEISIFGDVLYSVLRFNASLGLDSSGRARRFGLMAVAVGGTKIAQWVEWVPQDPLAPPSGPRAPSLGSLKHTKHPPGTP